MSELGRTERSRSDGPGRSILRSTVALPDSTELEQAVLGALLIDNSIYDAVSDMLRPDHFFIPVHGRIYSVISRVIGGGGNCDARLLKNQFADDLDLIEVGGAGYLAELMASVATRTTVPDYARQIVDLHVRRQIIHTCDEMIARAGAVDDETPALTLVGELEVALYGIAEAGPAGRGAQPFSTTLGEVIDAAQAAHRRDARALGIPTGLRDLNDVIGGLRAPDLLILAGRPSMGKSALATGIAWHAASRGGWTLLASLEMSGEQLGTRILSAAAQLSSSAVRRGELNDREFRRFVETGQSLASLKLEIDETAAQTIAHIRKQARRLKRRHGLSLIVVDYIQLIRSPGRSRSENRTQEVSEITRDLKALAKELDVPVLALSQLSRAVEQREDKRPQLSDLRESGSIEQDADIVMFVYRDEYYVERERPSLLKDETQDKFQNRYETWQHRMSEAAGKAEIIIGKQRNGRVGTAHVLFDGATTTFSDDVAAPAHYDPSRD
jgi:replicative DNA helicase